MSHRTALHLASVFGVSYFAWSLSALGQAPVPLGSPVLNPHLEAPQLVGDLDQDGLEDLVERRAAVEPVEIVVSRSLGTGEFTPLPAVAGPPKNDCYALSDVNLDGRLDVVLGWKRTTAGVDIDGGVQLLLNNGGGVLLPQQLVSTGKSVRALDVSDFNQDGTPDAIAGLVFLGQIRVFAGPTLTSPPAVYSGISAPLRLRAGNFTNDPLPDIVYTVSSSSSITILKHTSPGLLEPPVSTGVLEAPREICIGELNGDGNLDIVMFRSVNVRVALGNGAGGFSLGYTSASVTGLKAALELRDINQDGLADVPVLGTTNSLMVLGALGGGFSTTELFGYPALPFLTFVDGSGDGILDALAGAGFLRGLGAGVFDAASAFLVAFPDYAQHEISDIATGDWDRDGRVDAVTLATKITDSTSLIDWRRQPSNMASTWPFFDLELGTLGPAASLATGDFNGDDRPDTIAFGTQARFFRNDPINGFVGYTTIPGIPQSVPGVPLDSHVGDFNGDLIDDLLLAQREMFTGTYQVLLGNPTPAPPSIQPAASLGFIHASAVSDLTGDGILDLVAASTSGAIDVFAGSGNGQFAFFSTIPAVAGNATHSLLATDLTGDGVVDLATVEINNSNPFAFLGVRKGLLPGSTSFGSPVYGTATLAASSSRVISAGELNGSGGRDILALAPSAGIAQLSVQASGASTSLGSSFVGDSPTRLIGADINSDGRTDAFFAGTLSAASSHFGFLLNDVAPALGAQHFGTGTAGCAGTHGLSTIGVPQVGNSQFGIISTNGPRSRLGLLMFADVADLAGSDPFALSVKLHLNLFASTFIQAVDLPTDDFGVALAPLPIPASPTLASLSFHFQGLYSWTDCFLTPYALSTTRGLTIVVQP